MGILAEALIYYDQVLVNVTNQVQFAEFISWFFKQGKYSDLINLFNDGTLQIYDYAFITTAVEIEEDGSISLVNIQDPIQAEPNTFEKRFLYDKRINECLKHSHERTKLYKALRGKVIEVKASEFGPAIDNAKLDYQNPARCTLLLQAFLDEIYPMINLGNPPNIATVIQNLNDGRHRITFNINFDQLSKLLGKNLNFHLSTPFTAAAHCNRLLWSAANLNCDLYLGRPMSTLVGDKLYECGYKAAKLKDIIEQLNAEVEFPDIRSLVNAGKLNLDNIFLFRKKAIKFREWLQEEGEHDRNAIIAYHSEVAKELGLLKFGRKSLQLFGRLGGSALGGYLGESAGGTPGAVLGSAMGVGIGYIFDLASKMGENWKPVVFGNWIKNRIEKIIDEG